MFFRSTGSRPGSPPPPRLTGAAGRPPVTKHMPRKEMRARHSPKPHPQTPVTHQQQPPLRALLLSSLSGPLPTARRRPQLHRCSLLVWMLRGWGAVPRGHQGPCLCFLCCSVTLPALPHSPRGLHRRRSVVMPCSSQLGGKHEEPGPFLLSSVPSENAPSPKNKGRGTAVSSRAFARRAGSCVSKPTISRGLAPPPGADGGRGPHPCTARAPAPAPPQDSGSGEWAW